MRTTPDADDDAARDNPEIASDDAEMNAEALPEREDASALTVVGLGGSAGSIPALEAFFQGVPAADGESGGSAYVVVVHLSPDRESYLAEVLARAASMPVRQVTEATKVERGHVYVIPPGKQLEMRDGTLTALATEPEEGARTAVDTFFRTLAAAHGPQSAAVVLSGAGADGTLGIRQVKEAGGRVVAQSPTEAQYDGMPRNAIASGLVDYVLPVASMAAQIEAYWGTSRRMRLPEEAAPSPGQRLEGPDQETALQGILAHVRAQTGHDFSLYKRATILRRTARRLQVNGLDELPAYLEFLRSHPAEVNDLVTDMLISVTQFFRDADAWVALEQEVIPRLFQGKGAQDQVRAWCCGCATGEEAYTLAMLLLERAEHADGHSPQGQPRVQVFATDMDAESIARARAGVYPETIAGDISEERLRRWFYRQNGAYQVRKELREAVLFASHDVLRDTPFSRVDLITCRNLLIYLNREAQERVFDTFHFALRPDGRLFLGLSESADATAVNLFAPTNKQVRLYARRPVARGNVPAITPGEASLLPRVVLGRDLIPPVTPLAMPLLPPPQRPVSGGRELLLNLMERYGPPTALVDEAHDVVHLSGGAGRFLRIGDGEPTRNLIQLVHPDLKIELRTALYAATTEGADQTRVIHGGITLAEGNSPVQVRLTVRPVAEAPDAGIYFLVQFEELTDEFLDDVSPDPSSDPPAASSTATRFRASAPAVDLARQLEEENATLLGQLRSTIEQYEALTEELKASNEELQAMNEEQRSAAEELETSKEELQSVNEELSTVNYELKARVEEVSRANSDLQNFLASTDIGTLFLDRLLRVQRYTPAAETLFNLIPTDLGRPLAHVTNRLDYPTLQDDAERVLARLLPVEREVPDANRQRHFLARLLPYRSNDDRIEGVVVTFVDITARRQAEERFRLMVEGARDYAMYLLDADSRITFWSTGAERIFGWTEREALGQGGDLIFTPEERERGEPERELRAAQTDGTATDRRWHQRRDGSRFWADGLLMRLNDEAGRLRGYAKVTRDATEQQEAEEALRRAHDELEARVAERTQQFAETLEALKAVMAERQRLRERMVAAQEEERKRVSRELHDQTGQYLTGLSLGLKALEERLAGGNEAKDVSDLLPALANLRTLAGDLGRDLHRIAVELRPATLDDLGLIPALDTYVAEWSERTGIIATFEAVGPDTRTRLLPPEADTAVYRVVQEALNNVARHVVPTRTTRVSVTLQRFGEHVQIAVEDNGPGFDTEAVTRFERLGLAGMRERAELVGGTLEVESEPGQGTTVYLRVPA